MKSSRSRSCLRMRCHPLASSLCCSAPLALAALVITLAGLAGLVAYSVSLRTREIGIRVALGAQRYEVVWMVLRQAVLLTAAGLVFGHLASLDRREPARRKPLPDGPLRSAHHQQRYVPGRGRGTCCSRVAGAPREHRESAGGDAKVITDKPFAMWAV